NTSKPNQTSRATKAKPGRQRKDKKTACPAKTPTRMPEQDQKPQQRRRQQKNLQALIENPCI
ncbi:hypothetical protein, partial [Paraburkholderia hospita]|uniref:hypothetical protein n=1 Tax=Paraburkholderia hospita TaxID=169430 RepID=UPI001A997D35